MAAISKSFVHEAPDIQPGFTLLCECHETEAGEHVLLSFGQQLFDNTLLEESCRQVKLSLEVTVIKVNRFYFCGNRPGNVTPL